MSDFVMTIGGDTVAGGRVVRGRQSGQRRGLRPGARVQPRTARRGLRRRLQGPAGLEVRRGGPAGRPCLKMADVLSGLGRRSWPRSSPPSRASPSATPTSRCSPRPSGASTSPTSRRLPRSSRTTPRPWSRWSAARSGVVAAITPWNFPLTLAFWKIAPALLAGNTLVLKPSPFTPLTTLKVVEMLRDVMPPGVINVVSGGDELGAWMTGHPVPRKVSFTGSIETGKKVALSAAPDLKRVTLELGGNDPAIVLGRCRPGRGGQGHLRRRLQQQRPGVLGHQAGLRARVALRRSGRRAGRAGGIGQGG